MTVSDAEFAELLLYATKFGAKVARSYPQYRDEIIGAAHLGLASAMANPSFPESPEGRRLYVGTACWFRMRQEAHRWYKSGRPTLFADLAESPPELLDPHDHVAEVDEADFLAVVTKRLAPPTAKLLAAKIAHGRAQGPGPAATGMTPCAIRYHTQVLREKARHVMKGFANE